MIEIGARIALDGSDWVNDVTIRTFSVCNSQLLSMLPGFGNPACCGRTPGAAGTLTTVGLLVSCLLVPTLCVASGVTIPGEEDVSLFYLITHLSPAAYVVLFFIFVLSMVNLFYQGYLSMDRRPFVWLAALRGAGNTIKLRSSKRASGHAAGGRASSPRRYKVTPVPSGEGTPDQVLGSVRKFPRAADVDPLLRPTPLDGINHPMPKLSPALQHEPGSPRLIEKPPESRIPQHEFKFSSAVNVPSPEEIERREKEHLVVTGSVRTQDGKGLASVLVYLADDEGNRIGQSCRSMPETGEFKVQVNEAGTYRLFGYKRGFIMERDQPVEVPIESGKIEGLNFFMIPEGCTVHGRVALTGDRSGTEGLAISCIGSPDRDVLSTDIGENGEFKFTGIPHDASYFLEVRDSADEPIGRSESFHTGRKRDLRIDVSVAAGQSSTREDSNGEDTVTGWSTADEADPIEDDADDSIPAGDFNQR